MGFVKSGFCLIAVTAIVLTHSEQTVRAESLYSGSIVASFSNPVFSGYYIDTAGNPVFEDDTATASYSIVNSSSSAELISGDNFGGNGAPSEVIFFGSPFVDVTPNQDFLLGTLTYNNGTSAINSVLFGATLTLSVANSPSITPISVPIQLITTQNGGISPVLDADYLIFPTPISLQLHVYEGAGATANVIGRIVGDPQLTTTTIDLPPDQSNNGFLSPVPEPSTFVMSAIFLGTIGAVFVRKRLKESADAA